jgi:secreted PhoX family phosphatase
MAAFRGPGGTTVVIRNHELNSGEGGEVPGRHPFDPAQPGGTIALEVGPDRRLVRQYVTSSGSRDNCAGGATPWGTWLTCEESILPGHGYVFEVDPSQPESRLSRTPIRAMGRFSHEAAGVDRATGIVYLTEDDFRGTIPSDPTAEIDGDPAFRSSFLYRFLPNDRRQRPGALLAGGKLQALAIDSAPRNADLYVPGQRFVVRWITVNPAEPHDDALVKGAVRFTRLEGCHFSEGAFWFDDTSGGEGRFGQIFRYRPSSNRLELFLEGSGPQQMDAPDNICITPWGDLWFAEDGSGEQRIMGVTSDGEVYEFARNRTVGFDGEIASEFCGPTFSPDGRTFFVNVQHPGHTFAIWGPFRGGDRHADAAAARLATAPPRHPFAPRVSGELAEAAAREGLGVHEAAAFAALGVELT